MQKNFILQDYENLSQSQKSLEDRVNKILNNTSSTTNLVDKISDNLIKSLKAGKIKENNADSALMINDKSLKLLAKSDREMKYSNVLLDSMTKVNQEMKGLVALKAAGMDSINKRWDSVNVRLKNELIEMKYFKIVGICLAIFGLIGWIWVQHAQDKILHKQLKEAIKEEGACQSCGMLLKYDTLYKVGNKYCHHCFDGEKYVEPEIKMHELKNKIRARMKEQGLSKFETWMKVKSLSNLERWKRDFRW